MCVWVVWCGVVGARCNSILEGMELLDSAVRWGRGIFCRSTRRLQTRAHVDGKQAGMCLCVCVLDTHGGGGGLSRGVWFFFFSSHNQTRVDDG